MWLSWRRKKKGGSLRDAHRLASGGWGCCSVSWMLMSVKVSGLLQCGTVRDMSPSFHLHTRRLFFLRGKKKIRWKSLVLIRCLCLSWGVWLEHHRCVASYRKASPVKKIQYGGLSIQGWLIVVLLQNLPPAWSWLKCQEFQMGIQITPSFQVGLPSP